MQRRPRRLWESSFIPFIAKRNSSMTSKEFVKTSEKGVFQREPSKFRNWIDNNSNFPPELDRYQLYISYACPWASRCLMMLELKGLRNFIGVTVVHPVFQRTRPEDPKDTHVGWALVDPNVTPSLPGPSGVGMYSSEGATPDNVNNAKFIRDLYELCSKDPTRYTIPLLWDKKQNTIVSNESSDIVRMLNNAFDGLTDEIKSRNFYPSELKQQIDELNEWIYHDINNGVYKCGFATTQEAYEQAMEKLFNGLDRLEQMLSHQRFLCGNQMTEADIRLFVTLVRFDQVYYVHFKTNKKLIAQYRNLSQYVRDIYQMPGIAATVNMQHIKLHYYASHTHLNPFGIVPVGPEVDFGLPHDRDKFET